MTIFGDTVWAVSCVADGGNDQRQLVIESGFVSNLVQLLTHKEVEVQRERNALRDVENLEIGTND